VFVLGANTFVVVTVTAQMGLVVFLLEVLDLVVFEAFVVFVSAVLVVVVVVRYVMLVEFLLTSPQGQKRLL